jgi:hypothetical protein
VMSIDRREWIWVTFVGLIIVLVTTLPYGIGFALESTDIIFSGSIVAVEDGNTYLAAMRQGADGKWLFHIPFTPEPHDGGAVFLFYLLLGKLAALTNTPLPWMLHISRVLTTPLLLVAIYRLLAFFTPWIYLRRLGFILVSTGAGFGWLWVLLGQPFAPGQMPIDLWVPDAFAFLTIFTFPHLILAQTLILLLVVSGLQLLIHPLWSTAAYAALQGLLLSTIHPYSLPVVMVLLGSYWAWRSYAARHSHWKALIQLAAVGLVNLPYLAYSLWLFATNPVFHSWQQQNRILSPNPIHYVLGYGIVSVLALVGLLHPHTWRRFREHRFLVIWLLLVPVGLYYPSNLQRRFLDGYQLPVVLIALAGFLFAVHKLSPAWRRRSALALTICCTFTNLLLLSGAVFTITARTPPIFVPRPVVEAAHWLDRHAPKDSIVLAAYDTGNLLPAYASVRTFVGHGPQSVDAEQKRQLASDFFSSMSTTERQALLAGYAVDYIFYGPNERAIGGFHPESESPYRAVYHDQVVTLFRVEKEKFR